MPAAVPIPGARPIAVDQPAAIARLFLGSSCQCPRLFICTREALVWNRLAAGRYLLTERWQHGPQDLHLSRTSPRYRKSRRKLDLGDC
jgi:hypothetical protein